MDEFFKEVSSIKVPFLLQHAAAVLCGICCSECHPDIARLGTLSRTAWQQLPAVLCGM